MKGRKYRKVKITEDDLFASIISDAVIMQRYLADGQAIPLVIVDTSNCPQVEKAIILHDGISEGEVAVAWGKSPDTKYVFLQIESISPVQVTYTIVFDSYKHCGLMELILNSHLLYIQAGKKGDRLSHNFDKPKLLIQIPKDSFEQELSKILFKAKMARFKGLNIKHKDLKSVVNRFDQEWSDFISKRFK